MSPTNIVCAKNVPGTSKYLLKNVHIRAGDSRNILNSLILTHNVHK